MILERQRSKKILNPSDEVLARELRELQSTGKSAYASLTADDGSWVQVGGGKATCVLERKEGNSNILFRASQAKPVVPPEFDGARLCFAGQQILLSQNEWFRIDQVIEVFLAFRHGRPWPEYVTWRAALDLEKDALD